MENLIGRRVFVYEDCIVSWTTGKITKVHGNRVTVLTDKTNYTLDRILIKDDYSTMLPNGCAYLEKEIKVY